MNMGKRIRSEREALGWKQGRLSDATNGVVSQQAIQVLEARDSKTSEFLFVLADALGVDARWLMTGEGPKTPQHTFSIEMVLPSIKQTDWNSLSERQRVLLEGRWGRDVEDALKDVSRSSITQTSATAAGVLDKPQEAA